jgi:hypothetical protein
MRGDIGNAYRNVVGKPEVKRPLGRRKWDANIEINVREIGVEDMDWIHLAEDKDR